VAQRFPDGIWDRLDDRWVRPAACPSHERLAKRDKVIGSCLEVWRDKAGEYTLSDLDTSGNLARRRARFRAYRA